MGYYGRSDFKKYQEVDLAGYKTHVSFGALVGIVIVVVCLIFSIITDLKILPLLLLASFFGSMLPDLDCDTGIPFQILFGFFALVASGVTFYYLFDTGQRSLLFLIGGPVIVFLVFRFGIGSLFKKMTAHRGIFHSVPAIFIVTAGTVLILSNLSLTPIIKVSIGVSVGLGYFSHLLLDELNSAINLSGTPFIPNKTLGSSLELISNSILATLLAYIILGILGYLTYPVFWEIIGRYI
jgi:hypothetical protein